MPCGLTTTTHPSFFLFLFLARRDRSLIQLLASEDDEVVSIACYDVGEFARFYPNGRT